jgi:RNA polymerase-binding protein DksA
MALEGNESMVSQDSHQEVRARLTSERDRLQREIDALAEGISSETFQEDEGTDTVSMDPADDASEMFEREKNLTVRNTLQISLRDVNSALSRIDAGTYGICDNCGKPIGAKRLEAMPSASYCIDCQSALERTGHLPARQI